MYQKWIELGLSKGLKALEIYAVKSISLNVTVYQGKVDKCVKSEVEQATIRGIYRGKMGSVSIENFNDQDVSNYLDELIANAKVVTVSEPAIIYKGAKKYPTVADEKSDLSEVPLSAKIDFAKKLEAEVLKNKYCAQVQSTIYIESQTVTRIVNSKGLNLTRNANYCGAYAVGVFAKGEDIQTAYDIKIVKNFHELDPVAMGKATVKKGVAKLGGSSLPSGEYPVVFDNTTFADILSVYSSIFSAEACYRNLTPLKGKVGEKIALESITLVDDPLNKKALFKIPFDDEGVPCKKKKLIDKGVFTGFINNLKSAKLLGDKPSGNGFHGSVSPTNLILEPGKLSLKDLLAPIKDGIYITELSGLHAGVNTSSGDFSLQAAGFKIKDGKLDHPVKMIVVSGNFFTLLNNVAGIGKDLKLNEDGLGSPSVHISSLMIGGQ
ncbi:TldD/PmbA family protein [Acholeplasma sp. OttesenSCG-928-E16]|nr:TldD/PmbA family protein [Acholeplasma sp. OttesenSCG-928-E16]